VPRLQEAQLLSASHAVGERFPRTRIRLAGAPHMDTLEPQATKSPVSVANLEAAVVLKVQGHTTAPTAAGCSLPTNLLTRAQTDRVELDARSVRVDRLSSRSSCA
jgi:hypothetical protein